MVGDAVLGGMLLTFERALALMGSSRGSVLSWYEVRVSGGESGERLFDAKERLFGKAGPEVVLWRDAAGWCPFCCMAVLLLEEMKVAYRVRTVPLSGYARPGETKDPEYLAMVPDGIVPGIQLREGKKFAPAFRNVYAIFAALQDKYPDRYPGYANNARVLGPDGLVGRLEKSRYRRDPATLRPILRELDALLRESGGPFLGGPRLSAADCQLLPFLERIEAYAVYFHGRATLDALPFVRAQRLLDTARAECEAFRHFGSDAFTLARVVLRYEPSARVSADARAVENSRDFKDSDARVAAAKLGTNHEAVAKFALRVADDEVGAAALDDALRAVATTLLGASSCDAVVTELRDRHEPADLADAATALAALSRNVGVPRDFLPAPAAALRAHCVDLAAALASTRM
ncbi:hypothetical protein CTAYLR_004688 [Chrysophaeum taylorii]|uniref:GST N-terminal domain-containing protein n=1 Tax=Chrysophaeum taylorii TaxID=2483200 RepID=A0AAD7U7B5_9STRA|nr:hypothetical protein CTAYLR_004688 [Chrysophaeum taylorii]